jgi:hypothetical protein
MSFLHALAIVGVMVGGVLAFAIGAFLFMAVGEAVDHHHRLFPWWLEGDFIAACGTVFVGIVCLAATLQIVVNVW